MNGTGIFAIKDLSPLRYPGSKQKLVKYVEHILAYNSLSPDIIVEPFVGGGSIFLYFLVFRLAKKAIIGDKDSLVYSFWKTLFSDPDELLEFVSSVKVNIDAYRKYKNIARNANHHDLADLAKACLFLNRTSFSGIIANSAGPIGGNRQESPYRIDCRFNRKTLSDRITYIASFSDRVTVLPGDWSTTISSATRASSRRHKLFYYLDPPFYKKAQNLYRAFFTNEQHGQLRDFLFGFKSKSWLLSYDNALEIRNMYRQNKYGPIHVEMPYSINSRSKRVEKELIITPLLLPEYYTEHNRSISNVDD